MLKDHLYFKNQVKRSFVFHGQESRFSFHKSQSVHDVISFHESGICFSHDNCERPILNREEYDKWLSHTRYWEDAVVKKNFSSFYKWINFKWNRDNTKLGYSFCSSSIKLLSLLKIKIKNHYAIEGKLHVLFVLETKTHGTGILGVVLKPESKYMLLGVETGNKTQ